MAASREDIPASGEQQGICEFSNDVPSMQELLLLSMLVCVTESPSTLLHSLVY
jgi:hypothetical protein